MHGPAPKPAGLIGRSLAHDSAWGSVRGSAQYVDDITEPTGTLHAFVAQAPHAHARIVSMTLDAVRTQDGVVAVIAAHDIPGANDISCVHAADEPVFARDDVQFHGQPIFAVVATSVEAARRAAKHAVIEYEERTPILTIEDAMAAESFVTPPRDVRRGNPEDAISRAPHRLRGQVVTGGQEHFYLEGQVSMASPLDDGGIFVHCSSQNPSEVQSLCANVLGMSDHDITVEVRRMGGGFGGKETQPAHYAAIACLAAHITGRPVKLRLDRDDDMRMTGKRHDFEISYDVGFDEDGRILGIAFVQKLKCGFATDLSGAVADRGIFHADNAYFLENVSIKSFRCKTHTVSNTAFRGFGVPQGAMGIEHAILSIAHHLKADPLDVRRTNLYARGRDVTHYGQRVSNFVLPEIIDDLVQTSDYSRRRDEIAAFNGTNEVFKRGISLVPAMMGICFSRQHLNQAGALVHIYKDGSIALNHGGTEMGQGLFIKVAQILANELGVSLDRIKLTATTTEKVPNTSATASSSGSDLNGMAVLDAARKLKRRLTEFAADRYCVTTDAIRFRGDKVWIDEDALPFETFVREAYLARVSLSATGFFKTPHIHFDNEAFFGHPFLYFAFGAAVSEVIVDTLTGEYRVERIDILHDVGRSLNPVIDIGQIEGGFVQGMGWLTTEELWWDRQGMLRTHAPSTYKIPAASDVPPAFNVRLKDNSGFRAETPYWSKAVGEPPLILSISVHQALAEAVAAAQTRGNSRSLSAPATPERILSTIHG